MDFGGVPLKQHIGENARKLVHNVHNEEIHNKLLFFDFKNNDFYIKGHTLKTNRN